MLVLLHLSGRQLYSFILFLFFAIQSDNMALKSVKVKAWKYINCKLYMPSMHNLLGRTIAGFIFSYMPFRIMLFRVAWTLNFWQAWIYLIIFAIIVSYYYLYLWKKDTKLLERRSQCRTSCWKRDISKIYTVNGLASPLLEYLFLLHWYRFFLSHISIYSVIVGDILVYFGFFHRISLYSRRNTYTAATIEIAKSQKVISTGPYSVVRHPMYSGAFILLLGTPLCARYMVGIHRLL